MSFKMKPPKSNPKAGCRCLAMRSLNNRTCAKRIYTPRSAPPKYIQQKLETRHARNESGKI
jgi:hypothetical protein